MKRTKRAIWLVVLLLSVLKLNSTELLGWQYSAGITSVEWSPDGKLIAGSGDNGITRIWNPETREEIVNLDGSDVSRRAVAWSPTGEFLAYGNDTEIVIWDIDEAEQVTTLKGHRTPVYWLSWSPDGRRLASLSISDNSSLLVWDMENYRLLNAVEVGVIQTVQWSPDSSQLAMINTGASGAFVFDPVNDASSQNFETFRVRHELLTTYSAGSVAWHSDNRTIAVGDEAGNIYVLDTVDKQLVETVKGHSDWVGTLDWDSTGTLLASAGNDGTVKTWYYPNLEQAEVFQKSDILTVGIDFSPYGGRLAFGKPINDQLTRQESSMTDFVSIVVSDASLERLNALAGQCAEDGTASSLRNTFLSMEAVSQLGIDQLPEFIEQVQTLPADAIPAACAADLIAVAEAVIAKGE